MKKIRLGRYIDPLTDFGFKHIFGSKPNKELLIEFLNDILYEQLGEEKRIVDLEYGSTEQIPDGSLYRGVTVDLFCIGASGEQFIVEMQRGNQQFFKDRSLFYTSRIINRQLPKGGQSTNFELKETYFIGIF